MKYSNLFSVAVIGFLIAGLMSCTPKGLSEVTSPCVAIPDSDPWKMNPCIRRPVNIFNSEIV